MSSFSRLRDLPDSPRWNIRAGYHTLCDCRRKRVRRGTDRESVAINSYFANTFQSIDRSIRSTVAAAKNTVEQRRSGRFKASRTIACNLGRVLDLSAGGMRLLSRRELPDVVELEFGEPDNIVEVSARVIWRKQHGRREFESGLAFDDITPQMQQQLCAMARTV